MAPPVFGAAMHHVMSCAEDVEKMAATTAVAAKKLKNLNFILCHSIKKPAK
jgi:hypothetical protein